MLKQIELGMDKKGNNNLADEDDEDNNNQFITVGGKKGAKKTGAISVTDLINTIQGSEENGASGGGNLSQLKGQVDELNKKAVSDTQVASHI